jgi:hypothetical protein
MNDGWELSPGDALDFESRETGQFNSAVTVEQMNERPAQFRARNRHQHYRLEHHEAPLSKLHHATWIHGVSKLFQVSHQ